VLAAPAGVAGLVCAGCVVAWWADPTTLGGPLPVCPTNALLGINCPGCGALRMIYSLLHGDLIAAVQFNAVALIALPLLLWTWGGLGARPLARPPRADLRAPPVGACGQPRRRVRVVGGAQRPDRAVHRAARVTPRCARRVRFLPGSATMSG